MHPEEDPRTISANVASGSYSAVLPSANIEASGSINSSLLHHEYIVTEDALAGQRLNGGMSSTRRFFCLFITFDLLFTSLMWLICIMLNGDGIWIALDKEVYHYNVHMSLFDITLAAICRFVVLLLFYGLIHINHWIIVAISTAGTCAFLISKVFLFNWQNSPQPVFQVLLILTSFVLSWGEAWFLDFRVIPQEIRANQIIISSPDSERAPLIRSYVQGLPSAYTDSVANFYSPQGSPTGSVHRFGEQSSRSTHLTHEQVESYKIIGSKIIHEAWELLNNEDWKIFKQSPDGDVYVLSLPNTNSKIYKLTAVLNVKPRLLLDELFHRVENIPKWNPTLLESHKLDVIDDHTDITYQVSAPGAGGAVTSRDFITLRRWGIKVDCYIIAYQGVDHSSKPVSEKYIRGQNGIGCFAIHPISSNPDQCKFEWILNSDLKGWLPTYIVERAYVIMLFDYVKSLKLHLRKYDEL